MSSSGAGVTDLHTPHPPQCTCGTNAMETESHPQEPPLTDTCDIWSSARCVKWPCNTGRAQRPLKPTDLPQDKAKAELRPGPATPGFRAAFANPLLCGTDRGLGQSQPLAKCVPTRVSLCVLGTSPDPVCSQAASGPAIQASVSP